MADKPPHPLPIPFLLVIFLSSPEDDLRISTVILLLVKRLGGGIRKLAGFSCQNRGGQMLPATAQQIRTIHDIAEPQPPGPRHNETTIRDILGIHAALALRIRY